MRNLSLSMQVVHRQIILTSFALVNEWIKHKVYFLKIEQIFFLESPLKTSLQMTAIVTIVTILTIC